MEQEEVYAVQELYQENLLVTHGICDAVEHRMNHLHFHDGFEIWFTLSDGSGFHFENSSYTLNRGGLVLVNNSELHRTSSPYDGIYERYIISFIPDYIAELNLTEEDLFQGFINRPQGAAGYVQLTDEQIDEFLELVHCIDRYSNGGMYEKEMLKKLALTQLIILCNGYLRGSKDYIVEQSSERLKPILHYIKANISASLTLNELTTKFFISKSHLIRLFKVVTGMTPNEYIIMTRVMKARTYLTQGMPILKICELIGYADESHFIRTFKKIMGITPKQYGKLRKKAAI